MNNSKSPYSSEFIEARKMDLLARKSAILEQLQSLGHKDSTNEAEFDVNFPDYGDKEDDNATEVAEYASNLSMEENLETTLEMIDKALLKIDQGTYGLDEKTGEWISAERLAVMPTATKNTHV